MRLSPVTSLLRKFSQVPPDDRSRLPFLSPVIPAPLDRAESAYPRPRPRAGSRRDGHRHAGVTTSVGAEGLLVTDGVHVLIADSADGSARSVEGVLADAAPSKSLSAAARQLGEDQYSWRSVQDKALALVSSVAG